VDGQALSCVTDVDSLKDIMPDAPPLKGVKKYAFFSDLATLRANGVDREKIVPAMTDKLPPTPAPPLVLDQLMPGVRGPFPPEPPVSYPPTASIYSAPRL
jgi:hypothetical protein